MYTLFFTDNYFFSSDLIIRFLQLFFSSHIVLVIFSVTYNTQEKCFITRYQHKLLYVQNFSSQNVVKIKLIPQLNFNNDLAWGILQVEQLVLITCYGTSFSQVLTITEIQQEQYESQKISREILLLNHQRRSDYR